MKVLKILPFFMFLFLLFFFLFYPIKNEEIKEVKKEVIEEKEEQEQKEEVPILKVEIKGQVKKPGVYEVDKEYRVNDVVIAAGGFLKNADTTYINLAKKIKDEMVIIIYSKEEVKKYELENTSVKGEMQITSSCPDTMNDACTNKDTADKKEDEKQEENTKININTASKEELMQLTGVGEAKANAIISYREKTPFVYIEDIKNISGIGDSAFEKIKASITV